MLHKEIILPTFKISSKVPELVFKLLFLFVTIFSFLGTANFVAKQGLFIGLSGVLIAIYIILKGKLVINIKLIVTLIFSVSYSVACFLFVRNYFITNLVYNSMLLLFIEFFECVNDKTRAFLYLSISYAAGLFVAFVSITTRTYWEQGLTIYSSSLNSFWDGGIVSRTGLSLLVVSFIAICFLLIIMKNSFRKIYTIPLFTFPIFLASTVSIIAGNRSFVVSLFIMFFVMLGFKVYTTDNKMTKKIFVISIVIAILLLIIIFLIRLGVIPIPESILKIKLFYRIFVNNSNDDRISLYIEFFEKFYRYPFGGLTNNMKSHYVHNVFLDFYTFGGIISFASSTLFFIFLFKALYLFVKKTKCQLNLKAFCVAIIISILSIGLFEPVYQANPNCVVPLFLCYLFMSYINGEPKMIRNHLVEYCEINI